MLPQGGELEANLDHDWKEATTDGPPEGPEPHRVIQRPPTQRHGKTPLGAKQELPGARNPRSRSTHEEEAPGAESSSRENALGRKCPKMGASKRKTENAQSEDAKEATADRTPEGPDLHQVFRGPPTQGRRDPPLNAKQKPLEAYGGTPRGLPGVEAGKGRSHGGQESPKEEDYRTRRPSPDQQEDALETDWQTTPDHAGQEAAGIQANVRPEATGPPSHPQDSRLTSEATKRGNREAGSPVKC